MRKAVSPSVEHEARELFRQYCETEGTLSRQIGEPMQQYTLRRRMSEIELSEGQQADLLLDLAKLGPIACSTIRWLARD